MKGTGERECKVNKTVLPLAEKDSLSIYHMPESGKTSVPFLNQLL